MNLPEMVSDTGVPTQATSVSSYRYADCRSSPGQVQRHRILPPAVGEDALAAAVGVHDVDLAVLLERLLVQRRLVTEAMLRTAPQDAAIRAPHRVPVARRVVGAAEQVAAVRLDRVDVVV